MRCRSLRWASTPATLKTIGVGAVQKERHTHTRFEINEDHANFMLHRQEK